MSKYNYEVPIRKQLEGMTKDQRDTYRKVLNEMDRHDDKGNSTLGEQFNPEDANP